MLDWMYLVAPIHRSAWNKDSPKFAKEVPKLAHLRDAPTWIGEHDTALVSPAASDTPSYALGLRPD